MRKIHNTADTSIQAYTEVKASGQIAKEKTAVLGAIRKLQPCTSRMLASSLGIERTNITRSLNDLENKNKLVKKAYKDICGTTGKTVYYYAMIDWQLIN
jgi:predicted transcriptional regulator